MTQAQASSVALVTTVWLPSAHDGAPPGAARRADVLSAFLLYHLAIGVAKIFVFFDGDEQSQLRIDELHPQAQAHHAAGRIELRYYNDSDSSSSSNNRDDKPLTLHQQYERHCVNFSKLHDTMHSDVAARQMLNAELAMHWCLEHNRRASEQQQERQSVGELRWLLHLDVDELLYLDAFARARDAPSPPLASVLNKYTTKLEQQHDAHQMTLANYEAAPTQLHGDNYFASASKFRRHHAHIALSSDAQRAIAFWQQRTQHAQFFLFYDNGKSLVRVSDDYRSVPSSVHHWHVTPNGSSGARARSSASKSNFYDARRDVAQEDVVVEPRGARACVLHYPVCGLEWLRAKYERLGEFPDVWGGTRGERAMAIRPCFHTQARDALASQKEEAEADSVRSTSWEGHDRIERLYRSHVMLDMDVHAAEWQRQVNAGVCVEIEFVKGLLASFGLSSQRVDMDTKAAQDRDAGNISAERQQQESGCDDGAGSTPPPASAVEFTTEKAWMLASISQQYL